jgi:hypothetical protein
MLPLYVTIQVTWCYKPEDSKPHVLVFCFRSSLIYFFNFCISCASFGYDTYVSGLFMTTLSTCGG